MTPRQRVQAVYQGKTPDQVPLMLDLSHWYKKNYNVFFDLRGFGQVDQRLVDLHKQFNAVAYCEMGGHFDLRFTDGDGTAPVNAPPNPVLWLLCAGCTPPVRWGTVVKLASRG